MKSKLLCRIEISQRRLYIDDGDGADPETTAHRRQETDGTASPDTCRDRPSRRGNTAGQATIIVR
jgi:hypothetical protein